MDNESEKTLYRGYGPVLGLPIQNGRVDLAGLPPDLQPVVRKSFPPVVEKAKEPLVGITTDGHVVPDLFALQDTGWDPGSATRAATAFLDHLTPTQREAVRFAIDADEWRMWINAFPNWDPHGLRLEDLEPAQRDRALAILEASLSATGFSDARTAMKLNAALGELIGHYRDSLTEYNYSIALFGTPSATEPWGWQLWGHHLDVHCFIIGRQMVLTPTFIGAEPTEADRGVHKGLRLFDEQRAAGLGLLRGLRPEQARQAVLHPSIRVQDLPADLADPVNGRHLGGAAQDNRVIPYAGLPAGGLSHRQRESLLHLVGTYARRLPDGPAAAFMADVERHLGDTHIAWIGGSGDDDAFYYRVHSPVVLIEYDCQRGVFLDNEEPEPFHVHTIVRTPNGGDYGRDLLRRHLARHHPQRRAGR
ncbi:hypothetical protein DP939_20930 [Spongiactinospora rosea]|uniref:DUF3500 domain-containing protein n=1 Tax=Spongiactinospora rosea TaxID=2248750 RepID=A0A366LXQ4_9ACTN|nr:DUF3500 domain-containing protein [Spongiactinospora rosea]RBQ18333.1 hypothetical protein DP939_20930 [Spongiactinospora rosea]